MRWDDRSSVCLLLLDWNQDPGTAQLQVFVPPRSKRGNRRCTKIADSNWWLIFFLKGFGKIICQHFVHGATVMTQKIVDAHLFQWSCWGRCCQQTSPVFTSPCPGWGWAVANSGDVSQVSQPVSESQMVLCDNLSVGQCGPKWMCTGL